MAAKGCRRGTEGEEGRSLREGSVSMVTPPHLSAALKVVLRQQMSVSLGTLRGRVEGWSRESERSREQEDELNRFSG